MKKMINKFDWISLIAILLMILSGTIAIQYYFYIQKAECISNPFIYGAKDIETKYDKRFVGSGSFIGLENSPIIYFNSTNQWVTTSNQLNIVDFNVS